jgi:CRP-like cAMP-binding protein
MGNEQDRALLESSRLFKNFAPDVIDAVLPMLTEEAFTGGNVICMKGDDSDSLYIVKDGKVEVTVSSSDGKVILLGILSRGDVFGEVGLIDKESRTANITALSKVTLLKLTNDDFDKITTLFSVEEWIALTSYICFLFRGVTNNLEETVFLDGSVRVASKILGLFDKNGNPEDNSFEIEISQENLGRMAGLSREATNKALASLEDKGLIELKYKKIILPDIKKFRAMMDEIDEI